MTVLNLIRLLVENELKEEFIHILECFMKMLKLPVFLVGLLSAIQPFSLPLTLNFSWSLDYIRELVFGSPSGNYFTPSFVCSQHTAPRNIKLAQTQPSQGTNSHIGRVKSWGFILLCPEKFTLGKCRIHNTLLSLYFGTCVPVYAFGVKRNH